MVRDHQEVERPRQPRRDAGARRDRLAAREPVGLVGAQGIADHAGIGRIGRMQVRVAEKHPVREVLLRIGRVPLAALRDERFVELILRGESRAQQSRAE